MICYAEGGFSGYKLIVYVLICLFSGECKLFDNLPETTKPKLNEIKSSSTKDKLCDGINDPNIIGYIQKFCQFREEAANGELLKTAQFWMKYLDDV